MSGKADKFWTANDFEIIGACYCHKVENFLTYVGDHHESTSTQEETKLKPRIISPIMSTESVREQSSTGSMTPSMAAPICCSRGSGQYLEVPASVHGKLHFPHTREP